MKLLARGQIENAAALAEWALRTQHLFVGFDSRLATMLVALAQKNPAERVRCCQQVAHQAAAIGAAWHTVGPPNLTGNPRTTASDPLAGAVVVALGTGIGG